MVNSTHESRRVPLILIFLGLAIGLVFDLIGVIVIAVSISVYVSGGPSPSLNLTTIAILVVGIATTVGFAILLARRTRRRQ